MSDLSPLFTWRSAICESALPPTTRHVALTLSLYMNERGGSAFPGAVRLARETGLHEKVVRVHLHYLVKTGWLHQTHQGGKKGERRTANAYVAVRPPVEDSGSPPVQDDPSEPRPPVQDSLTPRTGFPQDVIESVKDLGGETSSPSPPKRGVRLPDSWEPNATHRRLARERSLDIEAEVEQFRDHHRAKGTVYKDWDAGFRTWLRNSDRFASPARTLRVVNGSESSDPPRPRDVPADAVYFNGSWMY